MAQEIEIEFKNLLTETEFERLLEAYPFPAEPITQTNHYFETEDMRLKEHSSALRIREKSGTFTLTLKEPHPDGLLETHDELTKEEASHWLRGEPIPKVNTKARLEKIGIAPAELKYFGKLTTERREIALGDDLLVLDYSTYNGQEDYEVELEVKSREKGEKTFSDLLNRYDIPKRRTPNKIERFYMHLKNLDGRQ